MQISAFAINTKGTWVLKFDYIIADALELGPLRMEAITLPTEFYSKVVMCEEKGLPFEAVRDVVCYCLANKPEDSDWIVLPVSYQSSLILIDAFSFEKINTQNGYKY